MARGHQIGTPKTGGRKKGTLNKRTRELIEILDSHGYCPISELIEVAVLARKEYERVETIYDAIEDKKTLAGITTPTVDMAPQYLKIMQDSARDIAPYAHAKRRPVDSDGKEDQSEKTLLEILHRLESK